MTNLISSLKSKNLQTYAKSVSHGFFTRQGGESSGLFQSLNASLFKEETPHSAIENRKKIAAIFDVPLSHLCFLRQVHGAEPHFVEGPYDLMNPPEADALVTSTPGLVLGIQTADCVPILLYAPGETPLVAAIHGGWRSLLGGVLENTFKMLDEKGARIRDVVASIGPCIAQESYEVGVEAYGAFEEKDRRLCPFFAPGKEAAKYQFDLRGLVKYKLLQLGVKNIEVLERDTYAEEELFFSCRRAAHKGEGSFGNQASCIGIAAKTSFGD